MTTKENTKHKLVLCCLLSLVLLGLACFTAQSALANYRLGDAGQVPFYARLAGDDSLEADDWIVIVFYRPPGCIPDDFNLLFFFDSGAFECQPATTDGFQIWLNGPEVDDAPIHSELYGLGAVPVWFVAWSEIQDMLVDDSLTITELASAASLVTGTATNFHETLHPSESNNKNSLLNYVASGYLDSGGSFWVHVASNSGSGHTNVQANLAD